MAASALRLLKSSSEDCSHAGAEILLHLATKCRSEESTGTLVVLLTDALQGKSGVLTSSAQKCAVLASLDQCAVRVVECFRFSSASLVENTMKTLIPCCERETDASCQIITAACLGRFCGGGASISKEFLNYVVNSMKKSKDLALASLISLHTVMETNGELLREASVLVPTLIDVVKDANKRAQLPNVDAVLALHLLLCLGSVDTKVAAAVQTAKLWTLLSASSSSSSSPSFLLSKALLTFVREGSVLSGGAELTRCTVVASIAAIYVLASKHYPSALTDFNPSTQVSSFAALQSCAAEEVISAASLLVEVLAQKDYTLRGKVASSLKDFTASTPNAPPALLWNLLQRAVQLGLAADSEARMSAKTYLKTTEENSVVRESNAERYSEAAKLLIRSTQLSSTAELACCLLVCCHPLVCGNSFKNAAMLFRPIEFQLKNHFHGGQGPELLRLIVDSATHSSLSLQLCGQFAVTLLFMNTSTFGKRTLDDYLSPILLSNLASDKLKTISEDDIQLFLNPEFKDSKLSDIALADIKITNEDRKKSSGRSSRKGASFGSDLIDDEDWAEQVKREKAKKLIEAQSAVSNDLQQKHASLVAEVQSRLDGLVNSVRGTLQLVRHLLHTCPELLKGNVDIVTAVVNVLSFQLVAEAASHCLFAVAGILEPILQPISG